MIEISAMAGWASESAFFKLLPSATIGTLLLTLVLVIGISIYSYCSISYRYWQKRGIDGPPPRFPFGNSLRPSGIGWHEHDVNLIKQYGPVFGTYQGVKPILMVADADLLKDIFVRDFSSFADRQTSFHPVQGQSLISSNGRRWKEQRSIISPTFTSGKMKAMHHLMKQAVENLEKYMDEQIKSGSTDFNNKELYGDLTLGVIASCAFATDTNSHQKHGDNIFVENAKNFFKFSKAKIMLFSLMPTFVMRWMRFTASPEKPLTFLINMSRTILEQRRAMGKGGNKHVDLLQLMMDSEIKTEDGRVDKLTDTEIIANIILVLIAGYETTSSLLTYATYALATNPDVQLKLRKEVEEAVTGDGGEITYDTVMNLKYLDAVVNETLRRYTPVMRSERRATVDYEFKSLQLKVEPGAKIHIPTYAIHHMDAYYPDPYRFDPERFMPDNKDKLVPYTFLPFLQGPRNCIGARFALLEAKTALASIVLKYELSRSERTAEPLDFSDCMFLMNAKEVIVRYTIRH